ncbi:DegT/DnrJ/EryC1/StrS family aminotransferase [Ravibacter arvi]
MKKSNPDSRRKFIRQNLLTGAGTVLGMHTASAFFSEARRFNSLHAPQVPATTASTGAPQAPRWPKWPMWKAEADEPPVLDVLRSGVWSRAKVVTEFEETWAKTIGAKRCVTTVNGTNAMICALTNLDVGGGDEVIMPPYTFIATPQAILQTGAMPVFVDTDRETFQMDVSKIEEKITPRTRAILPVHIAGIPCDIEGIMKIARKHNLVVVEDACQAWLSEFNHKKVGTFGDAGCFSFQNSKNIPMGEGGAIVSDDEELIDRCYSYHNFGIAQGSMVAKHGSGLSMFGTKLRLTEYQAAIGLAQLKRLEAQTDLRSENAAYLKAGLETIPGIIPYKVHQKVTRVSFHLFPFRYQKEAFKGLSRAAFLSALAAEGVPCSNGYVTLNNQPFLANAFQSKNFRKMYSPQQLDFKAYLERNHCPQNDILCNEEAVWFTQNILLGSRADMDYIVSAVAKIQKNAETIKKAFGK